jgi:hypothetical protein
MAGILYEFAYFRDAVARASSPLAGSRGTTPVAI